MGLLGSAVALALGPAVVVVEADVEVAAARRRSLERLDRICRLHEHRHLAACGRAARACVER